MKENATESLKLRIHRIIFGTETWSGKMFDMLLIGAILLSVLVVIMESVTSFRLHYQEELRLLEWVFTVLFTVEYFLRILTAKSRSKYIFSFYGMVDLLSIIPTYLSVLVPGAQTLLVIRTLRILRLFRILKLGAYLLAANQLTRAIKNSRQKILVFLYTVITVVIIVGSLMYFIEGEASGFSSIPRGIYWAIVTLTTVGYGDIAPQTNLGQIIAALLMIVGYGIIAVPTGIVTAEMTRDANRPASGRKCSRCDRESRDTEAAYCQYCGTKL